MASDEEFFEEYITGSLSATDVKLFGIAGVLIDGANIEGEACFYLKFPVERTDVHTEQKFTLWGLKTVLTYRVRSEMGVSTFSFAKLYHSRWMSLIETHSERVNY